MPRVKTLEIRGSSDSKRTKMFLDDSLDSGTDTFGRLHFFDFLSYKLVVDLKPEDFVFIGM